MDGEKVVRLLSSITEIFKTGKFTEYDLDFIHSVLVKMAKVIKKNLDHVRGDNPSK